MAVIAGIVLGFFATNYSNFKAEESEEDFLRSSEEIARKIKSIKTQGPGAQFPVEIEIPRTCILKFENEKVIAKTEETHSFDTEMILQGKSFGAGSHHLIIERSEDRIRIRKP